MSQLKVFKNPEFGMVRSMSIDGEPWFVGKDVAEALGYKNTKDALGRHVDPEDKRGSRFPTPFGTQQMTVINESGVYSLILRSNLPTAKEFKRWVTSEVLPSLRKNGGYLMGQEQMTEQELLASAFLVSQRIAEERAARIEELEAETQAQAEQIALAEPKVEYYDYFVDNRCTTSLTDTGKQIGMKPRAFIDWLIDKKYIFRKGKELLPYSQYTNKYFIVRDFATNRYIGRQTYVTEKGKLHFRKLCQKEGLIPPDQEIVTMVQPSDTFIM